MKIKNYQSIADATIELGRLTVIVGPSSVGKSALARAAKFLSSNARGTAFIRHGTPAAAVTATGQDWSVTLKRAKTTSGEYVVVEKGQEKRYTKLAGGVPPEVSRVLGIWPVDQTKSLNFASQFDAPYLLTESSNEVTRTLGKLTNVSTVLEAAREATRLGQQGNARLKLLTENLTQAQAELSSFGSLELRAEALLEAEALYAQYGRLSALRASLLAAMALVEKTADDVERMTREIPEPPDLTRILEVSETRTLLEGRILSLNAAERRLASAIAEDSKITKELETIENALYQALIDAGVCPTCNQTTKGL